MNNQKKLIIGIISIVVVFIIFLFVNSNNQKIYKTFDSTNTSSSNSINSEQLIKGSLEYKIEVTKQILDGYEGFEVFAESLGWTTNNDIQIPGSPNAIKGDTLRFKAGTIFPDNFRSIGKDSRDQFTGQLEEMIYEPLISWDAEADVFEPALATHWKIHDDQLTYEFRIDPEARFSDGEEVTAHDVVATFKLYMDEGHGDPNVSMYYNEKFNMPVATSKYIVRIKAKKKEWRLIYTLSSVYIYPSKYLDKTTGEQFIDKYQFEFMPGSGPYILDKNRTTNEGDPLIVLNRRDDYWANDHTRNIGIWNFDVIEFLFILDENQQIERFLKGDYDTYGVNRAQWWNQRFIGSEYPLIKRGLIQRKKFINNQPMGLGGIAFNSLKPPFDDIRVREAFCHLWDVKTLQEKLFFNEYVRKNSYFANSKFQNDNNPIQDFNPEYAVKLLNEAGWSVKPGDKWMTNSNGEIFEIERFPTYDGGDRIYSRFVSDLESIGIKMDLVVMQNTFEVAMNRKFELYSGGWVGSLLPNPEGGMHSKYSEELNSSNYTGIADDKIDELIETYNEEWDAEKRVLILQELDSIATRGYYWIFGWDAPYGYRSLNWDKFGMPEKGISYSGGWLDPIIYWWIDPVKKEQINKALKNQNITIPIESEIIDYWDNLKNF